MNPSTHSNLATIVEALPTPSALIDSAGQLVYLSTSCQELLCGQETDIPVFKADTTDLEAWFRDAMASVSIPATGSLVTYLQSPAERRFTITWSKSLPEGHILQITESPDHELRVPEHHRPKAASDEIQPLPTQHDLSLRIQYLLEHQVTGNNELTLYCVSLTGLRSLNDSYGYSTVDKLLALLQSRVADSTSNHPSSIDMIAQLSSGELMLLTQTPGSTTESKTDWHSVLSEHLVDVAERPYIIDQQILTVGACIGVACLTPEQLHDVFADNQHPRPKLAANLAQELLRQSIVARQGMWQRGKNGWQYFDVSMDRAIKQRLELENDLRRAIALDEFELYFQPKLQLDTDRISGFEALIRWHHPTRGMVPPFEFIPVAEELGLIIPLGEWIIREACNRAKAWPSDQTIAINISVVQFSQEKFIELILQAIAESGILPGQVELEITESVLLGNETEVLDTLHALKQEGVRIAMDDFGTGYSSMSYLRQFPFDTLKIDQSFVRDPENEKQNAMIRSAIFSLGKNFDMSVVAEGVETTEQMAQMKSEHCDLVQGYLVSKPVPFADTFELLKSYNDSTIAVPMETGSSDRTQLSVLPTDQDQKENPLLRLVYLSTNQMSNDSDAFEKAISQIMSSSIHNNANASISGALMFNSNVFAQVLEGSPEAVEATFERIQRDERHANVTVLDCARTDTRHFPNWAMAFIGETEHNADEFREIAALTDFSDKPLQGDRILRTLMNLVRDKSGDTRKAA